VIDWQNLLVKYMRHVGYEEGFTYTVWLPPDKFTPEEQEALRTISEESGDV
jgi:hypothetical protein